MTKLRIKGGVASPYYQGLIQVDTDDSADTLLVFDRFIPNFSFLKGGLNGGVVKVIVPLRYSNISELVVGILDDEREYNGKFADGVKAEVIDGTVTNILL
ncbi:hypothetical protein JK628_13070 [Shewanella sp. KX20019]|uniref:hypothetical protein n=1 Tax=Shewanella sp. KX20019 TaxID=2803864 RepID=UPI00192546FB|nr:hypothetical protein [Shewanella sp. KX20019]QQX78513.1 hypothetical protein JK628_13070 [Shewanella sp. KX20019]